MVSFLDRFGSLESVKTGSKELVYWMSYFWHEYSRPRINCLSILLFKEKIYTCRDEELAVLEEKLKTRAVIEFYA